VTRLDVRVTSVEVRGPLNPKLWIAPENYARFFPEGPAPEQPKARDDYAAKVLRRFATSFSVSVSGRSRLRTSAMSGPPAIFSM